MNRPSTQTVLVTGGSGFVAGWCIVELLKQGYSVKTTVRSLNRVDATRAVIEREAEQTGRLTFAAADLTRDDGWDSAMAGCRYVLHVASPLGRNVADDAEALLAAARDGTLRVLGAAARAGVERVVMTSAAATARPPLDSNRTSDESIWADPADPQFDAYRVSKILAERAAWDFMATATSSMTLTTILPGAVFGPVLSAENRGSVRIIQRLLEGRPPAIPRLGFAVVDVRDLAALHVSAMTASTAEAQRFLATGDFIWMEDIARILREHFDVRAAKVPMRRLPDWIFRLISRLSPDLRALAPLVGRAMQVDSGKARRVLPFSPRPVAQTIVDCARSLIEAEPFR